MAVILISIRDLTNPAELKDILKKYKLWAKKRFGQNFLVDRNVLQDIVATAHILPTDTIVEVGPGLGVLTQELLPRAKRVIAVEIDHEIIPVLKETTNFFRDKIDILHAHILGISLPEGGYKVVANIPYHLTSPILRKFLVETESRPTSLTLLVQKEVAEKICNTKKKSILSLFVEAYGLAQIVRIVPSEAFYPPPKVSSALLHINVLQKPKIKVSSKCFFHAVKMGFSQPRKKIKNNISPDILQESGIDENLRAENLTLADWEKVTHAVYPNA